jgi:predicted MFS family arabinose efflux permease
MQTTTPTDAFPRNLPAVLADDLAPAAVPATTPDDAPADPPGLSRRTLWVMSAACGVAVANGYYNQPLIGDFATYFSATPTQAGLVATAAQVGYGLGVLFFVPLGDLVERRRLVLALVWACAVLLAATAVAPSLPLLIASQLLVGATAVSAQVLIPLAVDLSRPRDRGRTIGLLMAGLLCGILLARTVAGLVAHTVDQIGSGGAIVAGMPVPAGWRAVFVMGVLLMVVLAVLLRATLPHRPPTLRLSYGRLLHSLAGLLRSHPPLWTASAVSGLSFAAFTAFWTTLSFLMASRFGGGAYEAGMFGVVGVAGALAAPAAGRLSDRRGPAFTVAISLLATTAAFGLMWGWTTIPGLIVGVLLMDLGVQSIQVAEQSLVMALDPDARSRLNTVYMVARFVGGAGGSAAGAAAWSVAGWPGVCGLSVALLAAAAVVHRFGPHGRNPARRGTGLREASSSGAPIARENRTLTPA